MKTVLRFTLGLFILVSGIYDAKAQSTQAGLFGAGHSPGLGGVPIRYVGWDASIAANAIPLSIEHRGTNNINFFTGATQRMTILGTAAGTTQGFVGIGFSFNNPTSILHVNSFGYNTGNLFRTDGFQGLQCRWQFFTGPIPGALSEKGVLFTDPTTLSQFGQPAANHFSIQASQGDLILRAKGYNLVASTPVAQEVVRITRTRITQATSTTDEGRVSITRTASPSQTVIVPLAMLHIGDQFASNPPYTSPVGIGGWRPWMDVGTYYCLGSDNMYIGLKDNGAMQTDAVVSWGNDPSSTVSGDRMLFVFTASQNPANGNAVNANGLEIGRMWTDGTISRTGFGGDASNLYSTGLDPGNTLEVNLFFATNVAGGSSGLRFTNLNSTSPPASNVANGNVLSVNGNGDVILVPGGGLAFGGVCNFTTPPSMTSNFQIPMNGQNFIWSGQGTTGNNVGIGLNNCTPFAKLHVVQNSGTVPPVASPGSIGILSINGDVDGVALMAISNNNLSTGAYRKVAGWFESPPSGGGDQVAIFVPKNGGVVQIGYTYPTVTTATLNVDGSIFATGMISSSDQTLKSNVQNINNAYDIVDRLRPVSFEWDSIPDSTMTGVHYGFIAQEVDTVLPNVVHSTGNGLLGVAYSELIPYLVAALQEEHSRNDSLAEKLDSLTQAVSSCCNNNARTSGHATNEQNVTLTNSESIVLNQNVPNPFAEQTTITYRLPESVIKAQMMFYDVNGKLIQVVDLDGRGEGQLNVFADDLSNGIYSYALVADGQVVDTKQMVKSK